MTRKRYTLIDRQGNVQTCRTRREAFKLAERLGWALVFDSSPKFGRANQWFFADGRWEAEIDVWEKFEKFA